MNVSQYRWVCGVVLASVMTVSVAADAATWYVDPINGSRNGDGSAADPWRTIEEVFDDGLIQKMNADSTSSNPNAPVKPGDTVLLRSGYHGEIDIAHYYNRTMTTIAAEEGHTPQLRRIRVKPGWFWTFRGLTVSPSFGSTYQRLTIVDIYSRNIGICRDVVVEDCFIYSVLDTSGWSAADWVSKSCHGINLGLDGTELTARGNYLLNVAFGIQTAASQSLSEYNVVENFSGDGINATNDGVVVQYNVIKNCYNVDDNHDDGIQGYKGFTPGAKVWDVTLRGNLIIERTDPNQPHPGPLQGIGCFDGPYMNWRVENNVVLTNQWHGITFLGAEGCTVINNTVFNQRWQDGSSSYQTWIEIGAYKSGAKSVDNVVRNNIAPRFKLYSSQNINLTDDHNLTITPSMNADDWFVDYRNFDMRLVAGSPAIDAGGSLDAPSLDFDKLHRPIAATWDCGAFEFGSLPPAAADAGVDQTVNDVDGDGWEETTLDGRGSYCLTGAMAYLWSENGAYLAQGETASASLTVGEHIITLQVTTDTGEQLTDEVVYTVTANAATPGDVDGDGDVDLDDFVILKSNFGTTSDAVRSDGDLDGDGDVDLDDFIILKLNFGV